MSLYFFSSQAFCISIGGGKIIVSTVKSLLIPLLIFELLRLFKYLPLLYSKGIWATCSTFANDFFVGLVTGNPLNTPSWFILALIWIRLAFFFMMKHIMDVKGVAVVTLGVVGLNLIVMLAMGDESKNNMFCFANALQALPYYMVGYIIRMKWDVVNVAMHKKRFIFIISAIWIVVWLLNGRMDMHQMLFGKNYLLSLIGGLCGSLFLVGLCLHIKQNNWLVFTISSGTIVILCSHGIMVNVFKEQFPFESGTFSWTLCSMVTSLLILVIEIPVILFVSRYMNFLMGGKSVQPKM